MDRKLNRSRISAQPGIVAALLAAAVLGVTESAHSSAYQLTDLTTDDNTSLTNLGLPAAANVDPNLVNPWGISFGPTTPFWVSDNGTGLATLYNAAGTPQSLTVMIAPPNGSPPGFLSAPTGQVFNNNPSDFIVSNGTKSGSANFIFATENGTISAWSAALGSTQSVIGIDNSAGGAVYKGLAIASVGGSNVLFATNFNSGMVEEYNSSFGQVGALPIRTYRRSPPARRLVKTGRLLTCSS